MKLLTGKSKQVSLGVCVLNLVFILSQPLMAQVQPLQHLDATVKESVITGEGSNGVVQWNDLAGNGKHALSYSGEVIYPSSSLSSTGKPGMGFSGGDKLLELFSPAESDSILDFTGAAGRTQRRGYNHLTQ